MKALLGIVLLLAVSAIYWWLVRPVWRSLRAPSDGLRAAQERKEAARLRLEAAEAEAEAIRLEARGEQIIEEAFEERLKRSIHNP